MHNTRIEEETPTIGLIHPDSATTENSKEFYPQQSSSNLENATEILGYSKPSYFNEIASSLGMSWIGSSLFEKTADDSIEHFLWIEKFADGFTPLQEAACYKVRLNSLNKPHTANVDQVMDRTLLLMYLKKRYGYKSYLEIGCRGDHNFSRVPFVDKVGVDPLSGGNVRATSDTFFASCTRAFDLIFIDGLHEFSQVLADVQNAMRVLEPNGTIVLHDCKPIFEQEGSFPLAPGIYFWNGTVWKAVTVLRTVATIDLCVGDFDWGLGVIRVRPNTNILQLDIPIDQLQWSDYEANMELFIQPKTFRELHEWLNLG